MTISQPGIEKMLIKSSDEGSVFFHMKAIHEADNV